MTEKLLIELDKSGAEWVVVAYVSGDERMIEVCENGEDPHLITGMLISQAPLSYVQTESDAIGFMTDPDLVEKIRSQAGWEIPPAKWFLPRSMSIRQAAKKANHGLNYDEGYVTFALMNEMAESEAKRIKEKYHQAYPGIKGWHEAVRAQLSDDRTLYACEFPEPLPLHRKQRFLEAWGHDLFRRAYSFVPQSTIGDVTNRAMTLFYQDRSLENVELLANGHDSLLFQRNVDGWRAISSDIRRIVAHLNPLLNFGNQSFRIGTDLKIGMNWGQMKEIKLSKNGRELEERLEDAWQQLS